MLSGVSHPASIETPRQAAPKWRSLLGHLYDNGGVILGLISIALLWGGVTHFLAAEREDAIADAVHSTENLARAFEEQTIRTIGSIDQSLLFAREIYQRNPADFDIGTWAERTGALTDHTFQISLVSRNGRFRGSNLLPDGTGIDLSDREHIRVHADHPNDDRLFISRPVFGRASNKWSVQVTRKLMAADGSFDGVIVISLDPLYLSQFYGSGDLGKLGILALIGTDGVVRASDHGDHATLPRPGETPSADDFKVGSTIADSHLLEAFAQAPAGIYRRTGAPDGIDRLLAYRKVRGLPLVVVVGLAEAEVLAARNANRLVFLFVAGLLSALLLAITVLVMVRQIRLRRAREQLRASEAGYFQKSHLLGTTLEHISQGIIMISADSRVQVCNQRAIEALSLPPDLMAREPLFDEVLEWQWQQGEFGKDGEAVDTTLLDFVSRGQLSNQPQIFERTGPKGRVLEVCSTPLPEGGVVRTYSDITARKETEAVLLAARDVAHDAARIKGEFLATMSHEIRSPMASLIGVLGILSETKLDDEQRRMARMVQSSAHSLLGVLNDILDFSKIDVGALAIVKEAVSVGELVRDVVQLYAAEAAHKFIRFTVQFGDGVDRHAELDPLRVRQILNNMLSNALKFTSAGQIRVDVFLDITGPLPLLQFAVQDTGIGMTAETQALLFNPFVQADSSTSRDYGGTGLGLSICKRLAELLDGSMAVRSGPGEGSTFTLSLPWIPAREPEETRPAAPAWASSLAGRGRVLVADDDVTNRWLTQRQLQMMGLDVDVAEDGEAALARLCGGGYDMLLTDCHMPHMDGVGLTQAVRALADPTLANIPIIGLTADVTALQQVRCFEAGMNELVHKPMDRPRLASMMGRHLPIAPAVMAEPDKTAEPGAVAVFAMDRYSDLFDPGDETGCDWLWQYLQEAAGLLATLAELAGHDREPETRKQVVEVTHRFRGASLAVGAERLAAAAGALERAAGAAEPVDMAQLYADLQAEHGAARQAITAFAGKLPPTGTAVF